MNTNLAWRTLLVHAFVKNACAFFTTLIIATFDITTWIIYASAIGACLIFRTGNAVAWISIAVPIGGTDGAYARTVNTGLVQFAANSRT